MKLTELLYPFAFLPVCLVLYYVLPKRCRNVILLAASLLFFAWGTPEYLVLLVLAILLNYFAGLELESLLEDGKTGHARLVLVLTILADLLPLLFFKYYGEAAAALNRVFVLSLPVHALPAPVGVSFYTFTLLSALSDVYHGRAPMEKNLIRFALFVSFFPKLTSGPCSTPTCSRSWSRMNSCASASAAGCGCSSSGWRRRSFSPGCSARRFTR